MTRLERVVALAVLAASGSAHGQAPDDQVEPDIEPPASAPPLATALEPPAPPAPAPPAPALLAEPPEGTWLRPGFALSAGGGVGRFGASTMHDTTGTAGIWNVRATFGTRRYLAFEVAYIGSAQTITRPGLSSNARLWGNGAESDLRFNLLTDRVFEPFFFGGAAYRFYSLSSSGTNVSDVANHANVFEVPVGAGIATYLGGFMIDVRGDYRWAWGDNLVPSFTGTGNGLSRWDVTANIGFEL